MKLTLKILCVFGLLCAFFAIKLPAYAQDVGNEDPMSYDPGDDVTTVDPGAWDSNLSYDLLGVEQMNTALDGIANSPTTPTPITPTPVTPAPVTPTPTSPAPSQTHSGKRGSHAGSAHHQHQSVNHQANHAGHRSGATAASHSSREHR